MESDLFFPITIGLPISTLAPYSPHAVLSLSISPFLEIYVQLFVTPWTVARQAPLSMGILQARILEWVAMSSSRGSSQLRVRTQVFCIAGRFFTNEPPGKPSSPHGSQFIRTQIHGEKNPCRSSNTKHTPPQAFASFPLFRMCRSNCWALWYLIRDSLPGQASWNSTPLSPVILLTYHYLYLSTPNLHVFGEGNGNPLQYSSLKIPWTEEPGRLQSMGLVRVGHDSATSFLLFTFMHWRRKWQPTPVFLPGES